MHKTAAAAAAAAAASDGTRRPLGFPLLPSSAACRWCASRCRPGPPCCRPAATAAHACAACSGTAVKLQHPSSNRGVQRGQLLALCACPPPHSPRASLLPNKGPPSHRHTTGAGNTPLRMGLTAKPLQACTAACWVFTVTAAAVGRCSRRLLRVVPDCGAAAMGTTQPQ